MKRFPVGLRMVKSAVAVFLCFVVYLVRGEGIPFYSAIAAILCMQTDVHNSVKVALNRTVGTLIGGLFGVLVLLAERQFIPQSQPILQYLLVSLSVIPIIALTVALGKSSASYISCVVFMSVTVSHGADVIPWLFGLNRMIDTLIGIFVSLAVNSFSLPLPRDTQSLFVIDLDRALPDPDGEIHPYTRVRLRRLVEEGAKIALATSATPAHLEPRISGMGLQLPAIVLGGAALYDPVKGSYPWTSPLPDGVLAPVRAILEDEGIFWGLCRLRGGVLHLHFPHLEGPAEPLRRNLHGKSGVTVVGELPADPQSVLCLLALAPDEVRTTLRRRLEESPWGDQLAFTDEPSDGLLLIRSRESGRLPAARVLLEQCGASRLVAVGGTGDDLPLMEKAQESFVPPWRHESLSAAAVLRPCPEATIRAVSRRFHRFHKESSNPNTETR